MYSIYSYIKTTDSFLVQNYGYRYLSQQDESMQFAECGVKGSSETHSGTVWAGSRGWQSIIIHETSRYTNTLLVRFVRE